MNLAENPLKKVKIVFLLKKVTFYKIRLKKVTFDGPLPPSLVYTETEQILGLVEPNIELFYFFKPYAGTPPPDSLELLVTRIHLASGVDFCQFFLGASLFL